MSSSSPTDLLSSDFVVPLEIAPTLDRIVAMLANMHDAVKAHGRCVALVFSVLHELYLTYLTLEKHFDPL